MGDILLPGDEGLDSGMVQTWKGTEAVENLYDEMNNASENSTRRTGDGSTTSKDGLNVDHDDETKNNDEDSEEEDAVFVRKINGLAQQKERSSKKNSGEKVAKGGRSNHRLIQKKESK